MAQYYTPELLLVGAAQNIVLDPSIVEETKHRNGSLCTDAEDSDTLYVDEPAW